MKKPSLQTSGTAATVASSQDRGPGIPRPAIPEPKLSPSPLAAGVDGALDGQDPDWQDEEDKGPKAGEMIAGKYRLDELLAKGGMGSVWRGWDTALDRAVAIKFMDSSIAKSKSLRARFDREAKAAAKLSTPHVVQIYEHGLHDKLPFMVLELLDGEDLHDRLKRVGSLPLGQVVAILSQTARGLRRAHAKGIVHRDLKPRNIFLAKDEDEELVKILDFGIAKNIHSDHDGDTTKTGQVLGSPNYMSPEQARGHREIDHRTDLWALAAIAWKCLTGQTLFSGRTSGDVIVKICTDPLPTFSSVVSGLSPTLDGFFSKALARDPDDRFQSAAAFAEEFRAVLRASADPNAVAAAGPVDDRLSGDWTPVSGATPAANGHSHPSLVSSVVEEPGLTPPPLPNDGGEISPPGGDRLAGQPPGAPSSQSSLSSPAVYGVEEGASPQKAKSMLVGIGVAVVVLAAIVGALVVLGGGDDETVSADPVDPPASEGDSSSAGGDELPEPGVADGDSAPTFAAGSTGRTATAEPPAAVAKAPAAKPAATAATAKPAPPPRRPVPPPPTATKTPKPKGRWGY